MTALIWSPFASKEDAKVAASVLLSERLVGCVNFFVDMDSLFQWSGQIEESTECGALFKTNDLTLAQAIKRLEELHPYETPVILGWKCTEAGAATRHWLGGLLGSEDSGGLFET